MMNFQKILDTFKNSKLAKQILVVGAIIILIVAGLYTFTKTSNNYQVIYANLDPTDVNPIEVELSKMNIKYQASTDGKSISVEADKIPLVQAHLASMGLPSTGDPGFSLLDNSSIGLTSFDQDKRYERALIGELQKNLIQGFNFIDNAIVKLDYNSNDNNLFGNDSKSKASVTITVHPGEQLSNSQVKAVKLFVAGAVQNLNPKDVQIMDQNGTVYNDTNNNTSDSTSTAFTKEQQIEQQTENNIKKDVAETLTKNFGINNYTLAVRADINFDEVVQNIQKYDPQGTIVSKQEDKETTGQNTPNTTTPAGSQSNSSVPEYNMTTTNGNQFTSNKDSVIENYDVGKTVETIKKHPELRNVYVTVTINQNMSPQQQTQFQQQWQKIIANAAGVTMDTNGNFRNGNVVVSTQNFETKNSNDPNNDANGSNGNSSAQQDRQRFIINIAFVGLGLILLVIFGWFMMRRKEEKVYIQGIPPQPKAKSPLIINESTLQQGEQNPVEQGTLKREPMFKNDENKLIREIQEKRSSQFDEEDELSKEQKELAQKAQEIAEENPERTAEFIKKMISEG